MRRSSGFVAAAAAAVVAGCVSTPPDVPPQQPLAPGQLGLDGAAYAPAEADWWRALDDPQLDRLVQAALERNPGLAGALARVRVAQEQANVAGASNDPRLSLDAEAIREKVSANWIFPPPYGGSTFWNAQLGLNLGWNLDFWGRQAALIDQARQTARVAELDAAGVRLMLSSAVAQAYVELARARQLEALVERAATQRDSVLELAGQRVRAGLDSDVDLRSAEANVALVALEREQVQLAEATAVHALAALTGRGADAYAGIGTPTLEFERALNLPAALPADLLAHRPDIAAARGRVEAARAGQAAAKAAFYPNVNLTAFAGWTAIGLDRLFDSESQQLSAGPAIHLPLFEGGRLQADYRRAGAEIDAATATYNDTVLRAVREVADQLARLQSLDRQIADQARVLAAAEGAYGLAEQRYGAGLGSYLAVLSAETQVLNARHQRVNLLADRTLARVALLVALGGSFKETTG
jgi:NodT family efflux transporter outer membrane factor (OMF) lipoprotein